MSSSVLMILFTREVGKAEVPLSDDALVALVVEVVEAVRTLRVMTATGCRVGSGCGDAVSDMAVSFVGCCK